MRSFYILNVTTHILAAFLWLGGMLFLAAVGAPVLRKLEDQELRSRLFREIGEQFRWVGWACIGVLLLTGTLNLHFSGVLSWDVLGEADFWSGRYGRALAGKLLTVTAMVAISAVHDFWLGPKATRLVAGTPEALAFRRRASLIARVNALLGVAVVWAAVMLTRGG